MCVKHSPIQQGQQGQSVVAHPHPAPRDHPELVVLAWVAFVLDHQRVLLGFMQRFLVQKVKLGGGGGERKELQHQQWSLTHFPTNLVTASC